MTLDEFEKKANSFMAKRNSTNINKNVANNETKSDLQKFEEKANKFLEKRNNTTNTIVSNTPQKTITEKMDSLWVESKAPNVLEKQNINATVKPVNISDFVNQVKNTPKQNLNVEVKPIDIKDYAIPKSELNRIGEEIKAEKERWDNLPIQDKIVEPFKNIGANFTHGDLSIKESLAWNEYRSKQDKATLKKAQEATKAREDYEASNERIGKGNALTKDFAQYLPQLGGQLKSGLGGAAVGAGTGAATGATAALVAGQLGPQVAVPEELATVPGGAITGAIWGGRGGYVAGTAKYGYDMMAGNAYKNLLDLGVPNDIALEISNDEAVINSLIEGGGAIVDLISLGIGKLASKGGTTAAKQVAKNKLIAAAKAYGLNVASEGLEEGLQEVVSIGAEKEATKKAGIEREATLEDDINRVKEATKGGLTIAAIGGLGEAGMNYTANTIRNNRAENQKVQAQINQDLQNLRNQNPQSVNSTIQRENITGLPKMNAQNQAQIQNIEQPNVTLPTQAEMAQNANMEQIRENTKLMAEKGRSIDNNYNLKYNINRGDKNGVQFGRILERNNQSSGIYQEDKSKQTPKYTRTEYEQFEKSITPITEERVTETERELINKYKTKYKKDVVLFDGKQNSGFGGGASLTDRNKIYIDINEANEFGYNMIASHEVMESDILHNKELKSDIIDNIAQAIINDPNFEQQKIEFWKGQEGDMPSDYLIAKDIICDRFAELDNNEGLSYKNVLSQETNMNLDFGINNFRNMIKGNQADTQSAFSMPENYISPVSDIQGATEFVNKATIKDVETLQKMVEEAEKNPDRIDLQFFAEKARETIDKLSRQQVRQAIIEETELENYNLDDANKISKAKMNFTTPVRVIEKIFNKETANKINENFFKPIKHNEAERIRRLNQERNDIKELDVKPGSAEDAAIQKFGEGEYIDESGLTIPYTLENLKQDFPESWQKLQKATNVIRNKYDTYLEEINEVLKDNGYDPIPKRKDYFRHFEELNDLFSILGVPTKVDDIPTDLNGMTADLKPGKQFFANALQRKGNKTTYSAIKGIDGYLDGAMNMLYHTKDIQKLRTLEKYIRDTYGAEKGLNDANAMTDEQKTKRINQINEGHLSEFAAWLMEYTNALAGKKSRLDRGIEEMFGRKAYKYLNLIKKQVGANMTGLNVNSALSNFISVTQAAPKTSKKALVKGAVDTVKNIFNNDGFVDKSDFLTTRFGSDKLAKNWWQKAGDVGQIFMSGTDYFTANLITRSKYQEFLDKGYTETEAMKKADEFADRLMAGRGKGDLPTAFESKMLGIVTQFQLEVTNQIDSMFYDTFQENYAKESNSKLAKEHPKFYNAMAGTFVLGQIFALAFLFNEGKEEATGAEGGAFDPIGIVLDAIKYYTDDNLSFGEATAKVVEDIANQLPFASIITGGGRLPIKEAFPDLLSVMKGESKLGDELWNLTNLLLPTGGGQVKKTTQGLKTFAEGGAYSKDAEGNKKLKYPVEQNLENFAKSALFGKWSTEGAKQYIDSGFKALSANQTEGYEKAKKAGITDKQFYDAYNAQKKIKDLDKLTSLVKKNEIDKATKGLSTEKRKILYETFGVAKGEWDNTRIVFPYEIKAQKEKLAREKLKTKKK